MLSLKRDIDILKQEFSDLKNSGFVHCRVDNEFNAQIITPGYTRDYKPVPTLKLLHQEIADYAVVCVMGPYGSGKSAGLNWQAPINVMQHMPKCRDGVRRAKAAFIRNTYDQLKQTTFEMFLSWFSDLGQVKATKKPLEILLKFNDEHGACELYIQFLSLREPEQYQKLRSSFFTFAYINEVSESPEGIISQVLGRTGRYPSMDLIDRSTIKRWYHRDILLDGTWQKTQVPYWSGVMCDTNPPEVDSELFNIFEKNKPRGYKLYKQPPGLLKTTLGWEVNRDAENIERLGLDYYAKQAYGATEEFIKVFCCGEYGLIKAGQLIYNDYNDNIHAVDNIQVIPEIGLRLSFDTWYTPACNVSQWSSQQLRVLAALYDEHITVEEFANDIVNPFLHNNFHGIKVARVMVDPAAFAGQKVQGATSDYQALVRTYGNIVHLAPTNKTKLRINAVNYLLKRINSGQPAIIIDKKHADVLRKGFLKHYVWRTNRASNEPIYDEPLKNKYSHNQDALQYDALDIVPSTEELSVKNDVKPFLLPPNYQGFSR